MLILIIIFRPYLNIEGKPSTQRMRSFYVFTLPIENFQIRMSGRFWIWKFFITKCDWDEVFLKYVCNLDFLKQNLIFIKIGKGGKFAVEWLSNDFIFSNVFLPRELKFGKNQKIFKSQKFKKIVKFFLQKQPFHPSKKHL